MAQNHRHLIISTFEFGLHQVALKVKVWKKLLKILIGIL